MAVAFVVLAAVPATDADGETGSVTEVSSFSDLKTAVGNDSFNIKLAGNIEITEYLCIVKTGILDLNGKTLSRSNSAWASGAISNSTLTVGVGGDLTINDSSSGGAVIGSATVGRAAALAVINGGVCTINGGTFELVANAEDQANDTDGWYTIANEGNLTIAGGKFIGRNLTGDGSSVIRSGWYDGTEANGNNLETRASGAEANLTINGGIFKYGLNTVKNDDYGKLTINGGTFSNTAQAVIMNNNVATINGGTFNAKEQVIVQRHDNDDGNKGITNINGGTFNVQSGYYIVEMNTKYNVTLGQVIVKAGAINGTVVGFKTGQTVVAGSYAGTVKIGGNSITFSGITVGSSDVQISAAGLSGSMSAASAAEITGSGNAVLKDVTLTSGNFKVAGVTIDGLTVSAGATFSLNGDVAISAGKTLAFGAPTSGTSFSVLEVDKQNSTITLQDKAKITMHTPSTVFEADGAVMIKFGETFKMGAVAKTEISGSGTLKLSGSNPFTVLQGSVMTLKAALEGDVDIARGASLQLTSGGQYSGVLRYGDRANDNPISFEGTGSVDLQKIRGSTGSDSVTISANKEAEIVTILGSSSVIEGGSISTTDSTTLSIPKDSKLSISGSLNAKVQNAGTIEVAEGGSLTLKEDSTVGTLRFIGGTISDNLTIPTGSKLVLAGNATVASGKTLTIDAPSYLEVEVPGSAIVLQSGAKVELKTVFPLLTATNGILNMGFVQSFQGGSISDIEFSGAGSIGMDSADTLSIPVGKTVTLKTTFSGAVEVSKDGNSASSLVIDQGGVYTGKVTHEDNCITVSGIKAVDNGKVTIKAGSVEITGAMSATEASAAISAADGTVILKDLTITEGTLSLTAPVAVEGTLTVSSGSSIEAKEGASIAVSSRSTLAVDTGATVSLSSTASISAESGSEIKVSNNATLDVKEDATVAMTGGATLTADTGSTVAVSGTATISADTGSKIAVDGGASITLAGDSKVEVKSGASMSIAKSSTVSSTGTGTVVVEQSAKVDVSGTLDAKTENSGQINAATGSTVSEDKVDNTSTGKVTKQTSFIVIPDTTTDSDPIIIVPQTTESTDNRTDVKTVACIAAALVVVVLAVFILADTKHR